MWGTPPFLTAIWLTLPTLAPTNSPYEFLAFCGVVGLGRLFAEGQIERLETIRRCASDPRWRMREGVAMALQRLGGVDMDLLIHHMQSWSTGNPLEQRAAAAALVRAKPAQKTCPRSGCVGYPGSDHWQIERGRRSQERRLPGLAQGAWVIVGALLSSPPQQRERS